MQVYIGIDWSATKHDVVWMNDAGGVITYGVIQHNVSGFQKFEKHRQQLQVEQADCLIGLETSHNLLIDYLWAQGYSQIYVVPPKVVKGSRSRYRSSGAYTDRDDARLLADILRTDRAALQPWRPDSLLTQRMRSRVSLHMHLTHSIVRTGNRLRSILLRYYPAALEVFDDLHSQVALRFIRAYPEPDAARALSCQTFVDFVRQQHYPCPANFLPVIHDYKPPTHRPCLKRCRFTGMRPSYWLTNYCNWYWQNEIRSKPCRCCLTSTPMPKSSAHCLVQDAFLPQLS